MFKDVRRILDEFEKALNDLKVGVDDSDEGVRVYTNAENTFNYFELHLAECLMKNRYINAKKVAQIILAVKGNED